MKFPLTLAIASALSLTACGTRSTLDVPPSTRASLPAIPAQIDKNPEPLGQLPDGTMGTLAVDQPVTAEKYGILAVRFNTLRALYNCVRSQVNDGASPAECIQ